MASAGWDALAALIAERDPQCRGAVSLGLSQPLEVLAKGRTARAFPSSLLRTMAMT